MRSSDGAPLKVTASAKTYGAWRDYLLLTLVVTAVAGVAGALYFREVHRIEQRLLERETMRVGMLGNFFRSGLSPVANHLRLMATGDGLQAYLATGQSADLERAVVRAVFFSRQQPEYDQIRYLDERGQEIFRVNRGGHVVPSGRLQNEFGQPYVQRSLTLAPENIHLSTFDLAAENGNFEEPLKPILRFATPIYDATGRRRGVYIIQHLGGDLLSKLQQAAPPFAHRLRVLNAEGYWLKADRPEREWGFALPGRSQMTLAHSEPTLWAKLAGSPSGQAYHDGGLLTWERITPGAYDGGDASRIIADDKFLIVASEVSEAEMASLVSGLREIFLIGTPSLVMFAAICVWFLRARRKALHDLRRSEQSLAVTLHSIGDAVLATDTQGRITRMNHVAEQLTGWSMADASGRPVAEVFKIIGEGTRRPVAIPVDEVLATGKTQGLANHTVLVSRTGIEHAIADSAAPIRDRDGRMHGVVLVFRDVTEERAAQLQMAAVVAELARERSRLKFIFDSVPIGISFNVIQPDGTTSRLINDAHLRICDLDRDEAEVPLAFARITHPEDRETQAHLSRQLESGEIDRYSMDKRYIRRDGRIVWVLLSFQQRKHPDGSREELALVVDITERKQAEEERDRFFTLSLDLLCISSADGYFKRVSPAVTDILGWDVPEFLAQPYISLVHPDDHAATLAEVERQVVAGEKVFHFENRYRHKDGSWRVLSWRSVPQPGGLMYATARDVTALKHSQDQIQRLNEELQQRAAQLESTNKELEAFSYSVSHDLRAPLRHVQGYVEMLTREAQSQLTAKASHYLKTISQAAREMGDLIDDLLSFSRMGRTEMTTTTVDLDQMVQETRQDLELILRDRPVVWKIADLPPVEGDPAMLKQVWANLLDNAAKYTRTRNPAQIDIGCAGEEDGRVVFFVRDNGAGFDMKYVGKLFGVFQRLHRAEEFEGTGIGLANVRRIISRHGGRIWADSELDVGSSFYFTLKPAPLLQPQTNLP